MVRRVLGLLGLCFNSDAQGSRVLGRRFEGHCSLKALCRGVLRGLWLRIQYSGFGVHGFGFRAGGGGGGRAGARGFLQKRVRLLEV